MSIHLVMDKQMIHLYDGTLPSNEKKHTIDTWSNMDASEKHYAKQKEAKT